MKSNNPPASYDFKPDNPEQTVYIIGDGPEAHITAIKLKQKGMKNVVVIGLRFDAFTRSTSFNPAVFYKISQSISPLKLELSPSDSYHIKDAERKLHREAIKLGVSFLCGKFECFKNNQIKIINPNESTSLLILTHRDDIIIDCTGTARAVLQSVNADCKDESIFKFTPLEGNPHKTYASIRLHVTPDLLKVSNRGFPLKLNPVSYAIAIEELRELGWKSYAIPYCHHYKQRLMSNSLDTALEKYVLYFQMPEINLENENNAQEIAIRVAKILLKLFRDNPDDRSEPTFTLHKQSKKYPNKKIVSVFNVEPYQTTPPSYKKDDHTPIMFHVGDSTLPAPFVLGKSLIFGIDRTNSLIDAMEISDGLIKKIDHEKYYLEVSKILSEQTEKIESFFRLENQRIEKANINAKIVYNLAYKKCINLEDREKIKYGLDQLNKEAESKLSQKINFFLKVAIGDESEIKPDLSLTDEHIQSLGAITEEISKHRSFSYEEKYNIFKLSDFCNKLGNSLYRSGKYHEAIAIYEKAVFLHENYLKYNFPDELLAIYSSLIASNININNHGKAIYYAKRAEKISRFVDPEGCKFIFEEINYNKARALMMEFKKYMKKNIKKDYDNLVKKVYSAICSVANINMAFQLTEEFELIKQKYPRPVMEEESCMEEEEKIQPSTKRQSGLDSFR